MKEPRSSVHPIDISLGILHCSFSNIGECFFCKESLMGGHGYVREGEKPLDQGSLHDALRQIFEYVIRFLLINIQTNCEELVVTDTGNQILRLDKTATGSVYKDNSVLHLGNCLFVDNMFGFVSKRAVQADQITGSQQLIKRNVFQEVKILVWERSYAMTRIPNPLQILAIA